LAVEKTLLPSGARVKGITFLRAPSSRPISEHSAAHGADKEREVLIPRRNQFIGELFSNERHFVKAADGRIRALLLEALFRHAHLLEWSGAFVAELREGWLVRK
jgi:hypothetical protein